MPLTKNFSEMYDDALTALAAASQRSSNVVNVNGHNAIRVDLKYNRRPRCLNYVLRKIWRCQGYPRLTDRMGGGRHRGRTPGGDSE